MESGTIINILAFLGAYVAMEGVAWTNHKYIMHGFLWVLHESHHKPHKGRFELNDLFFLLVMRILTTASGWAWVLLLMASPIFFYTMFSFTEEENF